MAQERIISVIDIGSNSIVLLVAECNKNRVINPVNEVYATTGLCKGIHDTGFLSKDAMDLTLRALNEMKQISGQEQSTDLIVTVTSEMRKATNKSEFLVKCHTQLGTFPQLLSSKEETRLTFLGLAYDVKTDAPIFTMDIGGNSTEIAFGTRDIMIGGFSLGLGSVSLSQSFGLGTNPWINNWISAKRHIRKSLMVAIDEVNLWLQKREPVVIAGGGSATSYAALLLKQNIFDRAQINNVTSYLKEVSAISRQLSRVPINKRLSIPGVEESRAENLPGGLLIISSILNFFKFDKFRISANGLRYGVLKHYLSR